MKNYHIYLIRHGKTEANLQSRYIGTSDFPLHDTGRDELYDKAETMIYPRVDAVYSSPLLRCTETAEILFPNREIIPVPEFKELNFGKFEGKTPDDLVDDPAFIEWIHGGMDAKPPEGESVSELCLRTYQGFYRILLEMMQENWWHAALITHSGVIANALACFGLPKLDPKAIRIAPGEGFEIMINPQMWQQAQAFELLGQVPFLPEMADSY